MRQTVANSPNFSDHKLIFYDITQTKIDNQS